MTIINKHKKIVTLVISVFILLSFYFVFLRNDQSLPESGIIPDELTAIKISEIILTARYGDIVSHSPLIAEYNDHSNIWHVQGTLSEDEIGGVPEIKLRSSDGKVVYVSVTY